MPNILPISDLRNYTTVLNQVDVDRPVYLTRNGRGTYIISKIDDYDRDATAEELIKGVKDAEEYSRGKKRKAFIRLCHNLGATPDDL